MERHPNDLTTDEEIDAAIAEAQLYADDPTIVESSFDIRTNVLYMKLSDGRRLFVPKEELSELNDATPEQAADIQIVIHGTSLYWPQIDDGLRIYDFLEHRWHKPYQHEREFAHAA